MSDLRDRVSEALSEALNAYPTEQDFREWRREDGPIMWLGTPQRVAWDQVIDTVMEAIENPNWPMPIEPRRSG